ncbi:hypothetical protein AVEN_134378-1, partial [Araneus ventricosus]
MLMKKICKIINATSKNVAIESMKKAADEEFAAEDSTDITVIQRRGQYGNGEDYFVKKWKEYKEGFGNLRKEFWL